MVNPIRPQGHTSPVSVANNRQVGGDHYKARTSGEEEHWDRVNRLQLDYFQGQITKYVERWKLKNGIEDLRKAQHFLQKYIELNETQVGSEYPDGSYVNQDRSN